MSDQTPPGNAPAGPSEPALGSPENTSTQPQSQNQIASNGALPSSSNAEAGPSSPSKNRTNESEDVVMGNGEADQGAAPPTTSRVDAVAGPGTADNGNANADEGKTINGTSGNEDKEKDQQSNGVENEKKKDTSDIVMDQGNEKARPGVEVEDEDTRPDLTELFAARREEELARRDRSLVDFLGMLDGYKPLIPEEITEYYLQRSGFECSDPRLKRLLSLSAQKFISDLSRDAYHFAKLRVNGANAGNRGRPIAGVDRNRVVLTMDDLSLALSEHGVNVKKPDYYL